MIMKKILILILIMAVGIGVIFSLKGDENPEIVINNRNTEITISKDELISMGNATTFPVVIRSSGNVPVEAEYTGIYLLDFFQEIGVDIEGFKSITFNASDGYRVIIPSDDIKQPLNTYITYARDGIELVPKSKGGNGPFQLVIRMDPFSQRWIKHVNGIIINY